ncbi:DUF5683 domain-containing protein [Pontibacter sp. MBLB2868]|uniref:DUF5683 domain-containing protein n=1 Tax=Pontibacter sp. MBLB2868 TaxID=3451555 RepID=UPI003F74D1B3
MKLRIGAVLLLLGLFQLVMSSATLAQTVTEGPDSLRVPVSDTLNVGKGFFLSKWDKPAKAALFSAIIPGAGQIYNKAYWKVPIIYATGGVLGYFLIDNNSKYQDFREALNKRNRDSSDVYINNFIYGLYQYKGNNVQTQRGTENLRYSRDFYRRNRDLTILISILAYGLNIAEAYVHAHLKEFDVSEDLSIRIQPDLLPAQVQRGAYTPGITFVLYTK